MLKIRSNIEKQLSLLEESITWVNSSLNDEANKSIYQNLTKHRRALKKRRNAIASNPAAAAYGESQMGKSYLISALLSEGNKPFSVDNGKGKLIDFKTKINPRGNEVESTSVVTRFSTREVSIDQEEYPIIAKLLSPTDIVLVLCEAYYNNLEAEKTISQIDLNSKLNDLTSTYTSKLSSQDIVSEDDIMDMEEYFRESFSKLIYSNIAETKYFERIASIIQWIPYKDWAKVFSTLWNENEHLTRLFNDLIEEYSKLEFVDKLYLPIDAVLREKGTLLDVRRLDEIYNKVEVVEDTYERETHLLYIDNQGVNKEFKFSKPFLCALIAELVFSLPKTIEESKPFLQKSDLLDFPGTRRFESTQEKSITDEALSLLLRRGKVDYMFQSYSRNLKINTLLFCQNQKQTSVSVTPKKIDSWIKNMVGDTAEQRESFKSKIPPLFIISTWFNVDLMYDSQEDRVGSTQSFIERWNQRFTKVLKEEVIKPDMYDWFENWTNSSPQFKNIFLLRDFYESSEEKSKIYTGYVNDNAEKEEIKPEDYLNFREDLKQSFLNYDFVKNHFNNPEEAWDRAASINEDGTSYIIENLTEATKTINEARIDKIQFDLNKISNLIHDALSRHYHSSDKDEQLENAKSKAGEIQFNLDKAFSGDSIKLFGRIINELILREGQVLQLYRDRINSLDKKVVINNSDYNTFWMSIPELKSESLDREQKLELLFNEYEIGSDKEARKQFLTKLKKESINLDILFFGEVDKIKSFSQELAESLIDRWKGLVKQKNKENIRKVLNPVDLEEMMKMYEVLFYKLEIDKNIASKISRYVDREVNNPHTYEMIADFSAEIFNRFIMNVGMDFYSKSHIMELQTANKQNNLGLRFENAEADEKINIKELFEKVDDMVTLLQDDIEALKTLPNYKSYQNWRNNLKIGLVSVCDIPNYDVEANIILGNILNELKTVEY